MAASAAKQLRDSLEAPKLTVAHRRSAFSSRFIANVRFAKIYDSWNSKNTNFIAQSQAWNDELIARQKGRLAGRLGDSDEKIMKALLTILGKDMELLRKSDTTKYLKMMRPECPYLELRASRPSIAAMVKKIHTKGVSVATVTNSFNRFALAGNQFIYERKNTSSQRRVYRHPDGSVSISYSYVKKGRGELIIRINKAFLAWKLEGIVNTQNADTHFFKAIQNKNLSQPTNSINNLDKVIDNKCGQVQTFLEGDATHQLLKNTPAIAVEDRLLENDVCIKQNSGHNGNSEQFFSGAASEILPENPFVFDKTTNQLTNSLQIDPKTDNAPIKIRQISEEGELYLQKQREDAAVRSLFGKTAKDNYAQRLLMLVFDLLYPDYSPQFFRKHEAVCLKSLKIIMASTKHRDESAFKLVSLAIVKAYRHFELHPEKKAGLYGPIGYLNPNYSGGLKDAVQNWVIKGYLVNMKRSKQDSKERTLILDTYEKGKKLFDSVIETHLKTQHGANVIFQSAKKELENYFTNRKVPLKTQKAVRTEFIKQCEGLLLAADKRVKEQKDPFYAYFADYQKMSK